MGVDEVLTREAAMDVDMVSSGVYFWEVGIKLFQYRLLLLQLSPSDVRVMDMKLQIDQCLSFIISACEGFHVKKIDYAWLFEHVATPEDAEYYRRKCEEKFIRGCGIMSIRDL